MDLTPHLEAAQADLATVAGADDATQAVAERLGRAVEAAWQLRLLDVLGEAALELSDELPGGHAEVRVAGRDARIVYVGPPTGSDEPGADEGDEGGTARLTLRMPEGLKVKVEAQAARENQSVNAWLVRAISLAVEGRRFQVEVGRTKSGTRIKGFAQS
jgi:hypothetical protein